MRALHQTRTHWLLLCLHRGRGMVTLAGDAAHTAFVDGTGLALALEVSTRTQRALPAMQCMQQLCAWLRWHA